MDTKQVYTNGTELVPIFRMKQWFEHLQTIEPKRKIIDDNAPLTDEIMEHYCNECDNHRCKDCKYLQKWKEDSYSRVERRTNE